MFAEMVSDRDVTIDGSWWSDDMELEIRSNETNTAPSPYVGFRFIMEVVEL